MLSYKMPFVFPFYPMSPIFDKHVQNTVQVNCLLHYTVFTFTVRMGNILTRCIFTDKRCECTVLKTIKILSSQWWKKINYIQILNFINTKIMRCIPVCITLLRQPLLRWKIQQTTTKTNIFFRKQCSWSKYDTFSLITHI